MLSSLAFISFFSLIYSLYYMTLIAIVFISGILINERPHKKQVVFSATLILLVGNLCFYKYTNVAIEGINLMIKNFLQLPAVRAPGIVFPLGLSFITFRLVHYIIELYRGKVPQASFIDFASYVVFFPTFLAGPVERFPRFHSQTESITSPCVKELNYGLFRILLGIVKKFAIADYLYRFISPIIFNPQDYSRTMLIAIVYISAIWLYMELSGYTDMAIGISRLFGYKIIENFNRPYIQKNIALFWRNWHISVYSWIRDYFYLPLFVYKGSRIKLYIGIFCTIMVFMLWHKGNWGFLMAGLYHGIGLIVWNLFQDIKKRYPFIKRAIDHRYLDPLSIFLTFTFVAFGISIPFFGRDLEHITALICKIVRI